VQIGFNKKGGLLLDSSAFEVKHTAISNNGPGNFGGSVLGGVRVVGAATSSRVFDGVSITSNTGEGIHCDEAGIAASGVLVAVNSVLDIYPSCGFTSCPSPSDICGSEKKP